GAPRARILQSEVNHGLRTRRGTSGSCARRGPDDQDLEPRYERRIRGFEGHTPPPEGPPLHRHNDHDEYWFIARGEYPFEVDGREIYASAGATVFAPRGSSHTFENIGTEPDWSITTVVPGGVDLFFEEVAAACPRGTRPDPAKLLPVFQKYNQELIEPSVRVRSEVAMALTR
ncbi:MAG TPA: cupin domain-containing protein, partial [Bryobacteraceae bacterium]|nr:cupin domain-containing protein [Bryobacteraceae bacterium]